MLSGCTTTPDWVPWHKPAAKVEARDEVAPQPEPKRDVRRRHRPPRPVPHKQEAPAEPQIAMIDPNALVGLKPPAVTHLLGAPAGTTKDEMSLVWTYAAAGCAMKVYFYPDLKTAEFHVLKFTLSDADGQKLDDDAPCRRKLLAQKNNDTG